MQWDLKRLGKEHKNYAKDTFIFFYLRDNFEVWPQPPEKLLESTVGVMSLLFRTVEKDSFLPLWPEWRRGRRDER